ncbi:RNA-binding protein [Schistosoma japonicum]|uniref:RNA-binding protein n=1 Tax=Schistosoma japonicum TaxID=6182 RepID=A0A4Z2D2V0_SCHJA|nr:RNA-binding protein 25 [Schistosoma japonicum]TNN10480.1 RNA-binding protein [Schistosoma japonicum]
MMYPHNPYFGLTPQYYGFVGIAPIAPIAIPPPPLVTVPTVIPPPNVAAPVVTTVAETQFYVREKPPVTTVFVGNIAECAPDQLIKTLLMRCGNILSWKRVQGASGKLQAFGFCEYEDPESTMRCVRLLNGFKVGPKPLLVKVDPKTEDLLNEYRKKKEKVGEEGTLGATPDEIDQSTQRDDETVKTALENIIKENAAMLEEEGGAKKQDLHMEGPRHLTIEDMDLDNDRKDLINREIESFRKRNEKEDQNDNKQSRSKGTDSGRSSTTNLQLYSAYSISDRIEREYRRERGRRSRSRSNSLTSGRSQRPITSCFLATSKDIDDEEESLKKRLEKKLREKEESYQKRLKQWEIRERKKANEYEHEREHERKRQRELQIEAQRLKEFFEDYDDNVEDPKYYRGSALHQRLKDREIEEAADERDRQKEIEQLETARRKLIEEGDPNAESIIFQMEQKMQEHLIKCLLVDGDMSIGSVDNQCPEPVSENLLITEDESKNTECMVKSDENSNLSPACNGIISEFEPAAPEETTVSLLKDGSNTFLFSMSTVEPVVRKTASAFTDEEQDDKPKKHGLSWLPPSALKANSISNPSNGANSTQNDSNNLPPVSALSTEEKKAIIKRIIEGIPTHKRELFAYPIDWDMVDADFVNSRIKPWVDKKIVSYIGEAEATLSSFICDQVLRHNPPERILADIAMVLDEEAEVFVVKMWRLLIYVIAEKKAGLSA